MKVFILKEGKEYNQGVAYLDDGVMINSRFLDGLTPAKAFDEVAKRLEFLTSDLINFDAALSGIVARAMARALDGSGRRVWVHVEVEHRPSDIAAPFCSFTAAR